MRKPSARRARRLAPLLAASLALAAAAQVTTDRPEGIRDGSPRWHALTGARLVLAPGRTVENGTLVMRDGIIVAAGAGVPVPAGARVWKLEGRTVYAGFVDLASAIGVPQNLKPPPAPPPVWGLGADLPPVTGQAESKPLGGRALASRNVMVRAEQDVAQALEAKPEEIMAARELGFTTVLAAPAYGVFRGQGALVNLGNPANPKSLLLAPRVTQHLGLDTDLSRGRADYPSSLMGSIALARQTLLDARWYRAATAAPARDTVSRERAEPNATLEALLPVLDGRQPVICQARDEQDYRRIDRLAKEFGLRAAILGNGYEYRRTAHLKAAAMPVIVPVAYPAPPEVDDPDWALDSPLDALQHWEQAPSNLAYLERAGIEFGVTASGLRDPKKEFWTRLREAVRRGLSAERALAALTTVPARIVGEQSRLGTLEPGRLANAIVASGDLFANDRAEVELVFVEGRPYPTESRDRLDVRGTWSVATGTETATWNIGGTLARPKLTLDGAACDLAVRGRKLSLRLPCGKTDAGPARAIVAEGHGDELRGSIETADGGHAPWSAARTAPFVEPPRKPVEAVAVPGERYPAGAYGIGTPAQPPAVLVRNATIWTSAAAGRLEGADLLVRQGRIAAVGRGLSAPADAVVIDAAGHHVTPGIIDAHSHIAIARGINEFASSVTAEARVGDVVDATDIAIYRQLAGGVTAANLLHGSANAIGGQSQVIKLRWGADAEGLEFQGATPSIKFALGENPKRSNFSPGGPPRYPQTRMGVEQILRDSFAAAGRYRAEREEWNRSPRGRPEPRRDLQLEALAEVLEGRRAVHVHSYRADELLMFARLARELGIRVAAFQHVLDGYKVADIIAGLGAGASTFSDWWTFKMEVVDAIPYNAAMMHRTGVLTSLNSDNDELARRLNADAAKMVKYGGLKDTEALALLTINPARQLGIDARAGSLEPGKDADFVIWSGPPLSTTSRVEETWIDGRRYFGRQEDRRLRDDADRERTRLVARALEARNAARPADAGSGDRTGSERPQAPRDALREHLEYLELNALLHRAAGQRGSYWNGSGWHECTEDAR